MLEGGSRQEIGQFPTCAQLRHGVLLGTIVHAIHLFPAEWREDSYLWRGHVLYQRDYSELRGCVSFGPQRIVGAFFNAESERSPFGADTIPPYDAKDYFAAAPPAVMDVASTEILPFFLEWLGDPAVADAAFASGTEGELDPAYDAPIITAAFWNDGNRLTSSEPWSGVYEHGASLLRRELMDVEQALETWAEDMALLPDQVTLAYHLFNRLLATATLSMRLTDQEYEQLVAHGATQLETAKHLLGAIGITLPSRA